MSGPDVTGPARTRSPPGVLRHHAANLTTRRGGGGGASVPPVRQLERVPAPARGADRQSESQRWLRCDHPAPSIPRLCGRMWVPPAFPSPANHHHGCIHWEGDPCSGMMAPCAAGAAALTPPRLHSPGDRVRGSHRPPRTHAVAAYISPTVRSSPRPRPMGAETRDRQPARCGVLLTARRSSGESVSACMAVVPTTVLGLTSWSGQPD